MFEQYGFHSIHVAVQVSGLSVWNIAIFRLVFELFCGFRICGVELSRLDSLGMAFIVPWMAFSFFVERSVLSSKPSCFRD